MKLRFLPAVFADVAEASDWYFQQGGPELADRFEKTFFFHVSTIEAIPLAFPCVYKEFHRTILRPFPYKMYFTEDRDTHLIVLVIHAARDPHEIQRLLRNRSK